MQLKSKRIAGALSVMTASLLAGAGAQAQIDDKPIETSPSVISPQTPNRVSEFDDDTYTDEGLIRIDGAVLVYQEDGGRVRAIEPVVGVTYNFEDKSSLSLKLTADILTGASPFGATPWQETQTLVNPPSTGSSGGGEGEGDDDNDDDSGSGNGDTVTTSDVPANELPIADGFNDKRYAVDVAYTTPWGDDKTARISGGVSLERDYKSFYGNVGFTREFNQKNTTLSASANIEYDISKQRGGHPTPLSLADGTLSGRNKHKTVVGGLIGISQVMNRRWLTQLNYNISSSSGYQTDPYRQISVVDPTTGGPVRYLYESRPDSRLRQSVYFGNKVAVGSAVTDASVRLYHDDWGIDSLTLNLATRIPLSKQFYIKPGVRYYTQSAADFFNYFLLDNQPLPEFSSPDSRLDKFDAITGSLMVGYKTSRTGELYARVSRYEPSAKSSTANAPGYLANRDLFAGTPSTSMVIGYTYAFK
jgi:hypothetical protein